MPTKQNGTANSLNYFMKEKFYAYLPLVSIVNFTFSFLRSIEDISSYQDFLAEVASSAVGSIVATLVVVFIFEKLWNFYIKK